MPEPGSQQLHARNLNPDIEDELACRVKDPLWYLSRQWQSGEFEAESGGMAAYIAVTKQDYDLTHVAFGSTRSSLDRAEPLDMTIEAENQNGAPAWVSEALEYRAEVETSRHKLTASEYHGNQLEWWHFDLTDTKQGAFAPTDTIRMPAHRLTFKGAPDPRWWAIEDGDAYFDGLDDAEPNVLSMLLPEFFYSDVENWYVLPLPIASGSLRQVNKVTVVDSFGVIEEIKPADDASKVFQLAGDEGEPTVAGDHLFVPHVAHDILDNDLVEDVRLQRDEQANLVWAVERAHTNDDGELVRDGGEQDQAPPAPPPTPQGFDVSFRLQSETPHYWIPYVPRYEKRVNGVPSGNTFLRRGRTIEAADAANPQYRTTLVDEAVRLAPEEIGEIGLRVRRMHRYVMGTDGAPKHWVARCRDVADPLNNGAGLRFDYLE